MSSTRSRGSTGIIFSSLFRLVARVRELEQEKEEILVMHKEVMHNMAESVADAKEKEGYKEVLKLYSTLLTENA